MKKWIYLFVLFFSFIFSKELDYSLLANKSYDSKHHFFFAKELDTFLLAVEKTKGGIALYEYTDDRKWKPVSNASAYDGYTKAENRFPDMTYDKNSNKITSGQFIDIKTKEVVKNEANKNHTKVIMKTTQGSITIELYDDLTPKTVENFLFLSQEKLYDGLIFHRIIKNFMIQGGDPSGDGKGGMSKWGNRFKDEIVESLKFDKSYLLAMANSGPNTNGSQFFITLSVEHTKHLSGKHTIFGKVIDGFDVVKKLGNVIVDKNDIPVNKQSILSVRIKD